MDNYRAKKTNMHDTHGYFFTAAISKFIETDWFLQIIVKQIFPTKHEIRKRLGQPVSQGPTSKQEAHGWL